MNKSRSTWVSISCTALTVLMLVSPPAMAEESRGDVAKSAAQDPDADEIVRGAFIDVRLGGGYTLGNATLSASETFPGVEGQSEQLGMGSLMLMSLGYDITETISIKAVGGMALLGGGRIDRVRDLMLTFGGAGIGVAIPMTTRFRLRVEAGGVFVSADNAVEPAETGMGVLASFGTEYYVHVRHFSVGVDLMVLAPLAPTRVFAAITPYLKYAF
jgi:hypothetical protein